MNGGVGFTGQSPVRGVDVGVTQPARFDADQDLARPGLRHRQIPDFQRLGE